MFNKYAYWLIYEGELSKLKGCTYPNRLLLINRFFSTHSVANRFWDAEKDSSLFISVTFVHLMLLAMLQW